LSIFLKFSEEIQVA